jgi:hypothetical protein
VAGERSVGRRAAGGGGTGGPEGGQREGGAGDNSQHARSCLEQGANSRRVFLGFQRLAAPFPAEQRIPETAGRAKENYRGAGTNRNTAPGANPWQLVTGPAHCRFSIFKVLLRWAGFLRHPWARRSAGRRARGPQSEADGGQISHRATFVKENKYSTQCDVRQEFSHPYQGNAFAGREASNARRREIWR